MRSALFFIFRTNRFFYRRISVLWSTTYTKFLFYIFKISSKTGFRSKGVPIIDITTGCQMAVGLNFRLNNSFAANRIGRQQPCFFILDHNSELTIGDNVGLSSTAIVCHYKVTIGNNVRTGGNTVIYDTDFHSLDPLHRRASPESPEHINKQPVCIGDDVFIGAHSTILKGVTIGNNAIVGACSLVTKDIPANQIWAGNPARYIRTI